MAKQDTDWAAVIAGILVAVLVAWGIWALWTILLPFILAATLAYILDPPVSMMMRRARCSRTWATSLVFAWLVLFLVFAVFLVWPPVVREASDLVGAFPRYIDSLQQEMAALKDRVTQINEDWGGSTDLLFALQSRAHETALALTRYLTDQVVGFVSNVANLVLIPLITFFFLKDKDRFLRSFHDALPLAHRPTWEKALARIDRMLAAYFRGSAIVGLIIAIVSFVGFLLIGMPYALLFSLVRGIAILIPYLGFVVSIIPLLILAAVSPDPLMMFLGVVILFAATEFLQGFVLTPIIIGNAIDLHELTVLLAIFVGGMALGLWGIVFALPAAAIIKIVLTEALAARRSPLP